MVRLRHAVQSRWCANLLTLVMVISSAQGYNYNYLNSLLTDGSDYFSSNQGLYDDGSGSSTSGSTIANLDFDTEADYLMTNQNSGQELPYWINIQLDYTAYVKEIMILFPQGYCPTTGCDPNETPL